MIDFSETLLPVVKIGADCFGVVVIDGVDFAAVVMPADCSDGCAPASVAESEDNGGVFPV